MFFYGVDESVFIDDEVCLWFVDEFVVVVVCCVDVGSDQFCERIVVVQLWMIVVVQKIVVFIDEDWNVVFVFECDEFFW